MKRMLLHFCLAIGCGFILLLSFLWWNHFPPIPQKSKGSIVQLDHEYTQEPRNKIKVASYNIHFGIGLSWKNPKTTKIDFLNRLDRIAEILQEIDADIVLLQEVDFASARSHKIDQAEYLARKAEYPFVAKAIQLQERFHPSLVGLHGAISHGICILSRYPILENFSHLFSHNPDVPFYLQWLFNPHGAQIVTIQIGNMPITVINAHLEPWSQNARELQMKKIVYWGESNPHHVVIGGDFNSLPPQSSKKEGLYLLDAPWFIDQSLWDLKNEKTILHIQEKGYIEAIPNWIYHYHEQSAFTYPADNPQEKLDYIFADKGSHILHGYVHHAAQIASDHLPIAAFIKLTSQNTAHHHEIPKKNTTIQKKKTKVHAIAQGHY